LAVSDNPQKAGDPSRQELKRSIVIISDTSPINYLLLCDTLEVLPKLYGKIIIPQAVHTELIAPGAPKVVRKWAKSLPLWVTIRAAAHIDFSLPLDPGEREAICLAQEMFADGLIVDETEARKFARERGLIITGTLGVLELADARGLVQLSEVFLKLRRTNFHISEDLLQRALSRAARRRNAEKRSQGGAYDQR
jgi:predicted nucleic acid-binding protein